MILSNRYTQKAVARPSTDCLSGWSFAGTAASLDMAGAFYGTHGHTVEFWNSYYFTSNVSTLAIVLDSPGDTAMKSRCISGNSSAVFAPAAVGTFSTTFR